MPGLDSPSTKIGETITELVIAAAGALPEPGARLSIELPLPGPADLVHADEPLPRRLGVVALAVDRHAPSRVRRELADHAASGTDPAVAPAGTTTAAEKSD